MAGKDARPPVKVSRPNWRTNQVQIWHDDWRDRDRTLRYTGECVVDGRRTYAFDDGENDPRGVLGDHAGSPLIAEEYEYIGADVPLCFSCANTYELYQRGLEIAKERWTAKP